MRPRKSIPLQSVPGMKPISEAALQKVVVEFLELQPSVKHGDLLYHHTPNGGYRNAREGRKFKLLGVKAGIPDLTFYWKGGLKTGLGTFEALECGMIELKRPGNSAKSSQKQLDYMMMFVSLGGNGEVCRSVEEVRDTLIKWGALPPETAGGTSKQK